MTVCNMLFFIFVPPSAIAEHPEDHRARCDATTTAAKEYDGLHWFGQNQSPLLHLHIEYHSGRHYIFPFTRTEMKVNQIPFIVAGPRARWTQRKCTSRCSASANGNWPSSFRGARPAFRWLCRAAARTCRARTACPA